jgi:excinuclease ABC subunit C
MLRDDKTYPYIKFTAAEAYPRVYFTRRIKKDGSLYFGPYFPASLARRDPAFCAQAVSGAVRAPVDLTRSHPRPCLQYYIHRCLGPCVAGTDYGREVRGGRARRTNAARRAAARLDQEFGRAHDDSRGERIVRTGGIVSRFAAHRWKISRSGSGLRPRKATDTDVLAYYAEPPLVAANLFHLRGGRVVDRREFYWEDLEEFAASEFVVALLKQLYLDAEYLPKEIHVPEEFEDRELLEEMLAERAGHRVEIFTPQRGAKRAVMDLVKNNAAHSFEQRFRVLKPTSKAIGEALQSSLNLPEEPQRIECFDISHIQGSDTVASMVVWEKGRLKRGDYRKFIVPRYGAAGS